MKIGVSISMELDLANRLEKQAKKKKKIRVLLYAGL